ncbi:N-6 DNA methylase [Halovivax cerinus]|uniref:site-specific DNA-methyltransferase (adenine-specific) n=1 Tax=Halovivax cerinus TaxID=1487865 RepID=A0ABD5NM21_9EURY|nr:N-6 DNA methylase [Halovivax cerinus]
MNEAEFTDEVRQKLADLYGSERIGVGHSLANTRLRPDLIIYETPERGSIFIVVEVKIGNESNERFRSGRQQLIEYLQNTEAQYGAVLTPTIDHIFSYGSSDEEPTILSSFPGTQANNGSRPLDSAVEARFLLRQLLDDLEVHDPYNYGSELKSDIFLALLYQLIAEREGIQIDVSSELEDQLEELQNPLKSYFTTLEDIDIAPSDIETIRATINYFGSFELSQTSADVASGFFDELVGRTELGPEQLSRKVARPMVDFAEVESNDRVLDPASGFGVLCREAASRGASVTGVEISESATIVAVFLNELGKQSSSVETVCADFFDWSSNDQTASDSSQTRLGSHGSGSNSDNTGSSGGSELFEHIVLNPPIGDRISADRIPELHSSRSRIRIEEGFIARALSLLKEGGTLVALVPEYILAGDQSRNLRNYLLHQATVEAIITFGGGVFSDVSFRGAVIRIRKSRSPSHQAIATVDVSSDSDQNGPNDISTAIKMVDDDRADVIQINPQEIRTLLPSQIQGERDVLDELYSQYDAVTKLEEVAAIESGTTREPEQNDTGLPYLDTTREVDIGDLSLRSPDDVSTVATPTDVLISVKGGDTNVRRVERDVIPSSRWAVVKFDSDQRAGQYQSFFESELGNKILEANRTGSAIRYITISALRDLPVPDFSTGV